jgi:hypothetical protein
MVTRFPGTFGNAYEPIGSTLSSGEAAEAPVAQSGATMLDIASIVAGNVLPIVKAQARPATTANVIRRVWGRTGAKETVATIDVMLLSLGKDIAQPA